MMPQKFQNQKKAHRSLRPLEALVILYFLESLQEIDITFLVNCMWGQSDFVAKTYRALGDRNVSVEIDYELHQNLKAKSDRREFLINAVLCALLRVEFLM